MSRFSRNCFCLSWSRVIVYLCVKLLAAKQWINIVRKTVCKALFSGKDKQNGFKPQLFVLTFHSYPFFVNINKNRMSYQRDERSCLHGLLLVQFWWWSYFLLVVVFVTRQLLYFVFVLNSSTGPFIELQATIRRVACTRHFP